MIEQNHCLALTSTILHRPLSSNMAAVWRTIYGVLRTFLVRAMGLYAQCYATACTRTVSVMYAGNSSPIKREHISICCGPSLMGKSFHYYRVQGKKEL